MESEPARSAMVRESLKEMDSAQILWMVGKCLLNHAFR